MATTEKVDELDTTYQYPPIVFAITGGHKDCMTHLLSLGANVNLQSGPSDYTPLMIAVITNQEELLAELIEQHKNNTISISYDITDRHGNTALMLAAKAGFTAAVTLLSPHTDHGIINYEGNAAAHLTNNEEIIEILKSSSPNPIS